MSTYFHYNGSSYEELEGAAMGSPVSAVIIANPSMESFEQQAITTSSYILCMYVGDAFTILDRKKRW